MHEKSERPMPTADEIKAVKGKGFLLDKTTGRHFNARVITVNGRVSAEFLDKVAEAARRFGNGKVAFTTRMTVEIQHIDYENIPAFLAFLAENGLEAGGTGPKVRPIVSCKGTTCHFGLIDTYGLSEKIHTAFYKGYREVVLPHKCKIAVGGCPNNCVKPDINDIGVVGRRVPVVDASLCRGCKVCAMEKACPIGCAKTQNGKITRTAECNGCGRCIGKCPFGVCNEGKVGYQLFFGGKWGKKTAVGRPLSVLLETEEQVMNAIESAILLFKSEGVAGERFGDTLARIGFENAEQQILDGSLLTKKEEILSKK